jgi:hypothetical protein
MAHILKFTVQNTVTTHLPSTPLLSSPLHEESSVIAGCRNPDSRVRTSRHEPHTHFRHNMGHGPQFLSPSVCLIRRAHPYHKSFKRVSRSIPSIARRANRGGDEGSQGTRVTARQRHESRVPSRILARALFFCCTGFASCTHAVIKMSGSPSKSVASKHKGDKGDGARPCSHGGCKKEGNLRCGGCKQVSVVCCMHAILRE